MTRARLWEQHCCLPLDPSAEVSALLRYQRGGASFASVNVGYAPHDGAAARGIIDRFTAGIAAQPGLRLAGTLAEVDTANTAGALAVAFDLEDSRPLDGDLNNVQVFYDLGVRTLLPVYNRANAAGSGCLDADDRGLTGWGRDLVAEMNRVGMVVDGSHCSRRTGLDLCEVSTKPVVYSHSCMDAVSPHERNITDEQALACAATGGVVGIAGVGLFLARGKATLEALVRHIDYAVQLIGPQHVGIGSDFSFDAADFNAEMAASPHLFPEPYTRHGPLEWVPPERTLGVAAALAARGYRETDVHAIVEGNFRRVAERTWN